MTLTRLASAVHYSKSQLSKIENGHQRPTAHLARRCEVELDCPGRLIALLPDPPTPTSPTPTSPAAAGPPSRRLVLTAGAATVLLAGGAPGGAATSAPGEQAGDGSLVDSARALLTHFRRMAQSCPPPTVLVPLAEQTRALVALAADSGSGARNGLLLVAARFAEFTGWMAQESGHDEAARRWTDHAARLAFDGGDHQLGHYGLVRRALMAYYRGHAAETVALSAACRGPPAGPAHPGSSPLNRRPRAMPWPETTARVCARSTGPGTCWRRPSGRRTPRRSEPATSLTR